MIKFYLDGVVLARGWLEQARIEQKDASVIAMYQRLLDGAIEQYEKIKNETN